MGFLSLFSLAQLNRNRHKPQAVHSSGVVRSSNKVQNGLLIFRRTKFVLSFSLVIRHEQYHDFLEPNDWFNMFQGLGAVVGRNLVSSTICLVDLVFNLAMQLILIILGILQPLHYFSS